MPNPCPTGRAHPSAAHRHPDPAPLLFFLVLVLAPQLELASPTPTPTPIPIPLPPVAYGPVESVYDWKTQHCADGRPLNHQHPPRPYQRDVPDAPAMAWRSPATNETFVSPGDSRGTWPSVGPTLDTVRHQCAFVNFNYSGPTGYEPLPQNFTSHEWLYAPYVVAPAPGAPSTTYFLVHNEYHGWEHMAEGMCNASTMVQGRCWYNSVTLSVSHDGGRTIRHAQPAPANLVAAATSPYTANNSAYGVFSPSQMVTNPRDGYVYSFPRVTNRNGTVRGAAVMRTRPADLADPRSWRFWLGPGDNFSGVFHNPYLSPGGPEPGVLAFGPGSGPQPSPSQPVPRYIPALDVFVMVGYTDLHNSSSHFALSAARDPWGPWSAMVPIEGVNINPQRDPSNPRGLYPALLDPASPSLNYDTLESDNVWLYWVQGRDCSAIGRDICPDMARDLVRQRVRLAWQ